jgi:hypothetical protein
MQPCLPGKERRELQIEMGMAASFVLNRLTWVDLRTPTKRGVEMKKIKTHQRPQISIVYHSLSVNWSIFIWLLAAVLVSFMFMGQAFADDNDRNFAGLYVGVLGDEYPEPITLKLSKEG